MNVGNIVGSLSLAQHHPQLIRPFTVHLLHRLQHAVGQNGNGRIHAPEQITVVVTDKCNLHCKMCHYAYSSSPGYHLSQNGHMEPALFYKLMDELPGHPIVSFTGGEPLLNRYVEDFISYARNKGCLTTLTTNGWLLKQRSESLSAAGLDVLIVSVDGPPEVHDEIRGRNSFARLEVGLQELLRLKRRPIVMVNTTISNINYNQLLTMYNKAKDWGVDGLNFNHLWMQTAEMLCCLKDQFPDFKADEVPWAVQPELVDIDLLADQLLVIRELNKAERMLVTELPKLNRQQMATWYRESTRFVKYRSTRCAWTRMKIWPDGNVKPCREWAAGNAVNENVMDIWHGRNFQQFRQQLATHGSIPICSRCCYMTYR